MEALEFAHGIATLRLDSSISRDSTYGLGWTLLPVHQTPLYGRCPGHGDLVAMIQLHGISALRHTGENANGLSGCKMRSNTCLLT